MQYPALSLLSSAKYGALMCPLSRTIHFYFYWQDVTILLFFRFERQSSKTKAENTFLYLALFI